MGEKLINADPAVLTSYQLGGAVAPVVDLTMPSDPDDVEVGICVCVKEVGWHGSVTGAAINLDACCGQHVSDRVDLERRVEVVVCRP